MVPTIPSPLITSPTLNGRSQMIITPAAIFDSVPCSASAIASPAAPRTARIEAVCTPNCPSTTTKVTTSIVYLVSSEMIGAIVLSMPRERGKRARTCRGRKPEKYQPAARTNSAVATLNALLTTHSVERVMKLAYSNEAASGRDAGRLFDHSNGPEFTAKARRWHPKCQSARSVLPRTLIVARSDERGLGRLRTDRDLPLPTLLVAGLGRFRRLIE
jgi:hypothetical protein